ncbi:MAG: hypothetical protein RJA70_1112 [Pseudomonadota bacterium]|jgi:DNA-binding beta-propeller fold protein YncE
MLLNNTTKMHRRIATLGLLLSFAAVACGGEEDPNTETACSDEPGTICPWAGTGAPGFNQDGLPPGESRLYWPVDVTFSSTGETYILDWNNHRVRVVDEDGNLQTVVGTDSVGDGPEDKADLMAPGAPGTSVVLNHPTQMLELSPGKMLLVSWHNHKLRSFDVKTGKVVVLCGRGAGFVPDGTKVGEVLWNQPAAARLDDDGVLHILDQRNQRIRAVDGFGANDTIRTMVGSGELGFAGDGGPPLEAKVNFPMGTNPPPAGSMAFDEQGRLYFSDTLNDRVRRVDFKKKEIETVIGDGNERTLNNPRDIERGPDGRIYVADELNHRVLSLDPETLKVRTIAGTGKPGDSGDEGPAVDAKLNQPTGLAFNAEGNLYIADTLNSRIRIVKGVAK